MTSRNLSQPCFFYMYHFFFIFSCFFYPYYFEMLFSLNIAQPVQNTKEFQFEIAVNNTLIVEGKTNNNSDFSLHCPAINNQTSIRDIVNYSITIYNFCLWVSWITRHDVFCTRTQLSIYFSLTGKTVKELFLKSHQIQTYKFAGVRYIFRSTILVSRPPF